MTPRQSLNILRYGILQNQRVCVTATLVVPFDWRGKSNSQVCDYNCDVVLENDSTSQDHKKANVMNRDEGGYKLSHVLVCILAAKAPPTLAINSGELQNSSQKL
ncbi:hypothetical protein Bbelb_327000 [Branchiostoma belcheri]|nr:hypothetical protein Bbelb_327000 [Branchiostoma belcheri]